MSGQPLNTPSGSAIRSATLPAILSWEALAPARAAVRKSTDGIATGAPSLPSRYVEVQKLKGGKNFDLFSAMDSVHKRRVLVKALRLSSPADAKRVAAYRNAARQAMVLHHSSICRTLEAEVEGTLYVSQELLAGGVPLHDLMVAHARSESNCPLEDVRRVIDDMGNALLALHREGVDIDLTPRHVVRMPSGAMKLIGVGTSALTESKDDEYAHLTPPKMKTNFTRGDEQSSQYTLAAIAYQMLLNKPARPDAAPPHHVDPTIPVGLSTALAKALRSNPMRRFLTLRRFKAATRKRRIPKYILWPLAALVLGLASLAVLYWEQILAVFGL